MRRPLPSINSAFSSARGGGFRVILLAGIGLILTAGTAAAEPPTDGKVGLGKLLNLPKGYGAAAGPESPRGTADEWRARYAAADRRIADAQVELKRLQGQLESHAGKTTSWNLAAPGLGAASPEDVPMNFSLSQQIRIQKETLEEERRKRKMLDVEADLAGVPDDWRSDSKAAMRRAGSAESEQ